MKNIEDEPRLVAAKQAVEDHREAMKWAEISDGRYNTGGGRRRDEQRLQALQSRVSEIRAELTEALHG